ncbi:FAD-binding oxidoreductase [Catellatospora sp. KI3]|uniref:FAD-binding oxidoreductase n=1 Tax=Catellatospora sp. KI3 TaxID=3041620 RepID=UPI002482FE3A|nr:FAD-binding oxidoreductase [Catellatospora sp. KI3]MDI1461409.1 FAD-binding oxidoreductase [Catellatospora sp. KI3]
MTVPTPPLAQVVQQTSRRAPGPAALSAFLADLPAVLPPDRYTTSLPARTAASRDYAHLSPVLTAVLPEHPADVVARPGTTDELAALLRLAHTHGVPVVPRGRGTGNYGQAVPLAGGLVVDLTRADRVVEVGDGWVHAQAGATFVALEAAARATGQEIAMLPSTVGSTIGGFLAGGAGGLGSIEHGWLWDGFVHALDVLGCPPREPWRVTGAACLPYLHAYGVTGVIATATVGLSPARDWTALLASFPDWAPAVAAARELLHLDPAPRLVSLDEPALVATYPPDPAMPAGRHSLRAVVDARTVDAAMRAVTGHGGHVEAVTPEAVGYLSTLSFNHVTLRARKTRPDLCHLQVGGEPLTAEPDAVRACLPGAMLHLDGLRTFLDPDEPARGRGFGGLLLSEFRDADTLYAGVERLRALGVHVVDPHTWLLGGPALATLRASAVLADPRGLLNPGKLPDPSS